VRQIRDTFLRYIADNIGAGIPIHALRDDPQDPGAGVLQANAINISFLDVRLGNGTAVSTMQVVLDVLNDDENTAVDWMAAVWGVLSAAFYARVKDYTNPSSPVATNKNITWETVPFKRIASQVYTHYSCVLSLRFTAIG
jgi:hypothetical protein